MDKKRRLIIKHQHLRKVRNALRMAIVDATYKKMSQIRKEENSYSLDSDERIIKELSDKNQALRRALDASICFCPICKSQTSDMIYNPYNKRWYCLECYEHNHEWYKTHPHSTERRNAPNPFP